MVSSVPIPNSAAPASGLSSKIAFSILQFNAWLIKVFGYDRTLDFAERFRVMPDYLAAENADVICLMEVWRNGEKKAMAEALRVRGYPYCAYQTEWLSVGDGLLVASKHPIRKIEFSKPFSKATRLLEGFTKKRAMKATVEVPGLGPVAICQAHLGATLFNPQTMLYDVNTRKILRSQVGELAQFLRESTAGERHLFFAGDLNFHYQEYLGRREHGKSISEEYAMLVQSIRREQLGLKNSFLEANGLTESDPPTPTYAQDNPYVVRGGYEGYPDETLDYILYRPTPGLRAIESRIVFRRTERERIPTLSDHYGIKSTFEWNDPNG